MDAPVTRRELRDELEASRELTRREMRDELEASRELTRREMRDELEASRELTRREMRDELEGLEARLETKLEQKLDEKLDARFAEFRREFRAELLGDMERIAKSLYEQFAALLKATMEPFDIVSLRSAGYIVVQFDGTFAQDPDEYMVGLALLRRRSPATTWPAGLNDPAVRGIISR